MARHVIFSVRLNRRGESKMKAKTSSGSRQYRRGGIINSVLYVSVLRIRIALCRSRQHGEKKKKKKKTRSSGNALLLTTTIVGNVLFFQWLVVFAIGVFARYSCCNMPAALCSYRLMPPTIRRWRSLLCWRHSVMTDVMMVTWQPSS